MTRIIVGQPYIHQNDLVKVIGMSIKSNPANTTFLIEWFTWANGKDERHTKEVTRRELEAAPTMERLYGDYQACLEVIRQQANKINELEAEIARLEKDAEGEEDRYWQRAAGEDL